MKRLLATLASTLALASPAYASTLVNPDGGPSHWQKVANASKVATVHARLTVDPDGSVCAPDYACTVNPGDTIWLSPVDPESRFDLFHELGHQFDYRLMTDADRAAYMRLATYSAETSWYGCGDVPGQPGYEQPGCIDYTYSPQESFADGYADCAIGGPDGEWVNIDPGSTRRVCSLIGRIAARLPFQVDPPRHKRRRRFRK